MRINLTRTREEREMRKRKLALEYVRERDMREDRIILNYQNYYVPYFLINAQ
jgi:hypothetical protein